MNLSKKQPRALFPLSSRPPLAASASRSRRGYPRLEQSKFDDLRRHAKGVAIRSTGRPELRSRVEALVPPLLQPTSWAIASDASGALTLPKRRPCAQFYRRTPHWHRVHHFRGQRCFKWQSIVRQSPASSTHATNRTGRFNKLEHKPGAAKSAKPKERPTQPFNRHEAGAAARFLPTPAPVTCGILAPRRQRQTSSLPPEDGGPRY